jgi:large subunit ribosomal protein L21
MYAIIEDSGTQIRVSEGDEVIVDLRELPKDGEPLIFDRVLFLSAKSEGEAPRIGAPLVAGARVRGELVEQGRTPRVPVVKFRRRTTYKRMRGHRQGFLKVRITSIDA